MANSLQLNLFGGVGVTRDGAPLQLQRRRLAILAVIAAAGERGVSREKVLGLLWADSEEERARASLAQALYALRRDLGAGDAIDGTTDLRLNREVLEADLALFRDALRESRWDDAVACYAGPFLDGFYLSDAPGLEHWISAERAALAREYREALERLIEAATAAGDHRAAVGWWRRLAAVDPLDAEVAMGLIRAFAAAGDRSGALQHGRVYEMLVRGELELEPDPEVMRLLEDLRQGKGGSAPRSAPKRTPPSASAATRPAPADRGAIEPSPPTSGTGRSPGLRVAAMMIGGILVVAAGLVALSRWPARADRGTPTTVAVGRFTGVAEADAPLITEMLATNLARVPGLRVVGTSRMYELLDKIGGDREAALLRAAREAGATELVNGTFFAQPGGASRLDLRRVDLRSGTVLEGASAEGTGLFDLIDRATLALAKSYGGPGGGAPATGLAHVTTGSLVAYRLYEQGLRTFYAQGRAAAHPLFLAALEEDSAFAKAAYWAARTSDTRPGYIVLMERARRLAAGATERERLNILVEWASEMDDPTRLALAESLVTRYPTEPVGHLRYGIALTWDGRFLEAVASLRRAVAMDSLGLREPEDAACIGCDALAALVYAYMQADSMEAAERESRRWTRRAPGSFMAWRNLADVLAHRGRFDEALAAERTAAPLAPRRVDPYFRIQILLRAGDYAQADADLARLAAAPDTGTRHSALWWQAISLRAQGRLSEAMAAGQEFRRIVEPRPVGRLPGLGPSSPPPYEALVEAQVRFEQGDHRGAAALFEAISRNPAPGEAPSRQARHRAWFLTHTATALAAAGDTARLGALADTIEVVGRRSAFVRDHRLHHHVRGLLYAARGRHEEAAESFRRAIYSPTGGYTRSTIGLARSLLALGRPTEAVYPLQAGLRGGLAASNYYTTYPELHDMLAQVFDSAGRRDSAVAHYRAAARAWTQAEPPIAARRDAILRRIAGDASR